MTESYQDPTLPAFEKALKQLYGKKWSAAAKALAEVIKKADSRQLKDRAGQYLAICEERQTKHEASNDPYLQAVFEKNRGNLEEALSVAQKHQGKEGSEEYEAFAYLIASIQALLGDNEAALESLDTAIRLEPKNRVYAFHDPDLEDLREVPEFQTLVATGS